MGLKLKGKQLEKFSQALMSAFLDYDDLARLVAFELDHRLQKIAPPDALPKVVLRLILWAEQHTKLDALLRGALEQNPDNETLRLFAQEIVLSSDEDPEANLARRFEATFLVGVGFQNVVAWRERMAAAERCVCRIVGPNNKGTGFLVGPNAVLTNSHVVDPMRGQKAKLQFDYKLDAGESSVNARVVELPSVSPVAESKKEELDYALLELPEPIGERPAIEGGSPRGYVRMTTGHPVVERAPLFILQHPEGDVLKICAGPCTKQASDRIHYLVNTEGGSSGSPVFNIGWGLVALHHSYEANANEGIPISAILKDIRDEKAKKLLGS